LAHGVANRVGKLRAYGNAICAPLATRFVQAVMAVLE
jgi:DNA (cytosine-5)-methyltransferase 1